VEPGEEEGAIVGHGILVRGDIKAESGQEGRQELMNSLVLLMGLIAQRARGTGGAEIVVADVDIWCGHMAGTVCDLVEMVDCLSGGGNPNVAGEQDGSLHLRKSRWAVVGLAGDVHRAVWVDNSGAGRDDNGVIRKSGGKGKEGNGSLVGVHISAAQLPCILLGLASGGALATVGLFLLLLATLLLLQRPVPSLLLELGVPRVVLDGTNLVHMVV